MLANTQCISIQWDPNNIINHLSTKMEAICAHNSKKILVNREQLRKYIPDNSGITECT